MSHAVVDCSDLAGKAVLVTGATGFIGRHVVRRLQNITGTGLIVVSRSSAAVPENATLVQSPLEDLTPETWRHAGIGRIDVVLHLGAFTPKTRDAADCVDAVYRDNLIGTRARLDSLPAAPDTIVYSSTIDVYAAVPDGAVLDEFSPIGPISLYGHSKFFCEQLVKVYARTHRGEAPSVDGNGTAQRDFLYVDDAVEAILRAAIAGGCELGPINIVRGASRSIREVVDVLARLTGFRGDVRLREDRPTGPSLRVDNRRMRDALGTWNLVPLEEGLRRQVDHVTGRQ